MLLGVYKTMIRLAGPFLPALLAYRAWRGKELPGRMREKLGHATQNRKNGPLLWLHAASVGEAQSALILIEKLRETYRTLNILITTGTVTSHAFLKDKLPPYAVHQFAPFDHPSVIRRFLDHWRPDAALRIESEIWPLTILALKARGIPCALVNARLSEKSYRRWSSLSSVSRRIFSSFAVVLTQTRTDTERFMALGASNTIYSDNIKYSAKPIPYHQADYEIFSYAVRDRPLWLLASSHDAEEALACRVHKALKNVHPRLLTIIVPRHPNRGKEIVDICDTHRLHSVARSDGKKMPLDTTDIYIADTIGELGLFYALSPVACIGRSFSDDGGGGHNPIEAAQHNCAVLHGPHVQFQQNLYDDMKAAQACIPCTSQEALASALADLLVNAERRHDIQARASAFARTKSGAVNIVMTALKQVFDPALKQNQQRAA